MILGLEEDFRNASGRIARMTQQMHKEPNEELKQALILARHQVFIHSYNHSAIKSDKIHSLLGGNCYQLVNICQIYDSFPALNNRLKGYKNGSLLYACRKCCTQ